MCDTGPRSLLRSVWLLSRVCSCQAGVQKAAWAHHLSLVHRVIKVSSLLLLFCLLDLPTAGARWSQSLALLVDTSVSPWALLILALLFILRPFRSYFIFLVNWTFLRYEVTLFIINSAFALNLTLFDSSGTAPPVVLVSTASFHLAPFYVFMG